MKKNNDSSIFINRELSWLNFNSRVLDEAGCGANPLLERLKFIAIFSSNLDEFFMVRIAGLRQVVELGQMLPDPTGLTPQEHLPLIRKKLLKLLKTQQKYLFNDIFPALEKYRVKLRKYRELPPMVKERLSQQFSSDILPVLTPLAVDPSHPFPILNNGSIEIAVSMTVPDGDQQSVYAFVEVPELLPRFIPAGETPEEMTFVLLEDLIMEHLHLLFGGCKIGESFPFRITRDMDFSVEADGAEDLLLSIEKKLLQRRHREPIRLEVPHKISGKLYNWLAGEFHLGQQFRYESAGMLHLKQLWELIGKVQSRLPELLEPSWPPIRQHQFFDRQSIFESIKKHQPILSALPFHSFDPVVQLLEQAAHDPNVLAIKQTLYRVSGNSPVVRALQQAAENGKQVTVIVELKARFDEGNNIQWARRLENSGAHVVYGISGLKIHCKALLIVRRENNAIRRYVHLGTGNYNDKTATLYTDMALWSCDDALSHDVSQLFNIMTGYSAPQEPWNKIAAAPFDLRTRLIALIHREMEISDKRNPGRMILKMNSLSDPELIRVIDQAVRKNVKIDLIVRGICCYKPPRGSHNVRIISIVDRFLEHARIFYFKNGGKPEYYLASADLMYRNLDRRIELFFPVENPVLQSRLRDVLQLQLHDREKGRRLTASGSYTKQIKDVHTKFRSQSNTYEYFKQLEEAAIRPNPVLPILNRPEAIRVEEEEEKEETIQ